jgi:hypothetical protein
MSRPDDSFLEMQRYLRHLGAPDALRLDESTAERLLDGSMSSDDAPPAYRFVAHSLDALRGAATGTELASESVAVAAMVACVADQVMAVAAPRRSIMGTKRRLVSITAASLIGGATLFTGLAAANALPGAAQSVASDMLSKVGVSVPDPNSHAGAHPDGRGQSSDHTQPPASSPSSTNGKGSDISGLAHTTPSTGVDKGAAISTEASGGNSQAGQHGSAATGTPPSSTPPVSTPNRGGTGTSGTASDARNTTGSSTANTNSDGHSTAGSDNATGHKP